MDPINELFGRHLRRVRKLRGLTQEDLSVRTGIGRATVASIELGRQAVALHQAVGLCKVLGVKLADLLEEPAEDLEELRGVIADSDLAIVSQIRQELP